MAFQPLGLLLGAILLSICAIDASVPHPLAANYSIDILRLAKAAHIKAYMGDEKEQACNNFYNYACANWPRLHPARKSKTRTNYLEELQELYIRKSADMLKSTSYIVSSPPTWLCGICQRLWLQPAIFKPINGPCPACRKSKTMHTYGGGSTFGKGSLTDLAI